MSFLGSIIGGIGSLLGGSMQQQGAIKGGKIAAHATLKANRQNLKYQKQFAQRGIRWRVRDARDAGIHPLAALGAQTASFSPSFVGATQAGEGVAQGAAAMGQGISRAATALGDIDDRQSDFVLALQKLQLENMSLQNSALASQIAQINQPGTPPAAPPASVNRYLIDGQGGSVAGGAKGVETVPLTRLASDPDKNWQEAGSLVDKGWLRTADGWAPVKSKDAMDRMDDDTVGSLQHAIRNQLVPIISGNMDERGPFKLRPGYHWASNPFTGNWWVTDNQGNHVPDYRP